MDVEIGIPQPDPLDFLQALFEVFDFREIGNIPALGGKLRCFFPLSGLCFGSGISTCDADPDGDNLRTRFRRSPTRAQSGDLFVPYAYRKVFLQNAYQFHHRDRIQAEF